MSYNFFGLGERGSEVVLWWKLGRPLLEELRVVYAWKRLLYVATQGNCWCIHKWVVVDVGSRGGIIKVNAVDSGLGCTNGDCVGVDVVG